uniref:Uncharacterized protein n=1 Tax=Panagrolaimus sp. JU765 TaxID=591449 RepID=A0AC34RQG1_9BILA
MLRKLIIFAIGLAFANCQRQQLASAIQGIHCAKNQVVNKVTFYEDGAIEAECGPIPCGASGAKCIEDQQQCRSDTPYVFSGMKWAPNGQSLLLRCCSLEVGNKMYVGTDMISLGSFYAGGPVDAKDKFGHGGAEYDFVSSIRAEQGGVRIWVHRIMCASESDAPVVDNRQRVPIPDNVRRSPARVDGTRIAEDVDEQRRQNLLNRLAENRDSPVQTVVQDERPVNPLQYRPNQRSGNAEARLL